MLCPVCRGGAVYLNFPGVGTLRGLVTDWPGQTPDFTSGHWSGSGEDPADCRWRMVEMEMATG